MYDLIAIGDVVTDAFIRLKEASVNCNVNKEHCTISMRFGDKIPYESVDIIHAVGNSPNAAVAASRLGLKVGLVVNIGDDQNAQDCLNRLQEEGVSTEYITHHYGKKTNYHYVLWYEDDRTILVRHEEYDQHLPDIEEPKWVYLSSLGENSLEYHEEIAKYLAEHPSVNLAFQPGTFQMKLGKDKLKDIYSRTKIYFSNIEEAERVLGVETLGPRELARRMHELGPEIVVLTDGPRGAYASDTTNVWFQPPYPDPKPPVERTGAGDAFSSTVLVALMLGKDLPTALSWGAINSMSVVQQVGAQKGLLKESQIEDYLKQAPPDFIAKVI